MKFKRHDPVLITIGAFLLVQAPQVMAAYFTLLDAVSRSC